MERRAVPYPVMQAAVLTRQVERLLADETAEPQAVVGGACALS